MHSLRLGIIGLGNMGYAHARSILAHHIPRLTLTAGCDSNPARLSAIKDTLGDIALFENASDLIASGLCDAVLIATPHYFHPPIACKAFSAGLHVLTEKPAGVCASTVYEMNRAAVQSGKVFGIMFNQRTNPAYKAIKSLVASGTLGTLHRVNWVITDWYRTQAYYDSGAWRATWAGEGGGLLLNQCPHQLDLLQWICGMPQTVSATMAFGKWHDIEVEDEVCAHLTFPNGARGLFLASTGDPLGVNRLEITLTRGKILMEDGSLRVFRLETDDRVHIKTEPSPYKAQIPIPYDITLQGENSQHDGILRDFTAAVLDHTPLLAPGAEGICSLMLANAMLHSATTNSPLTLPPHPENALPDWSNDFDKAQESRISASKGKKSRLPVYTDTEDLASRYKL